MIIYTSSKKSVTPSDVVVLNAIFYPRRAKRPERLRKLHRELLRGQGVRVITAEAVLDGYEPVLDAGPDVVHLTGPEDECLLWQKERLLQAAYEYARLHTNARVVAWIDADILLPDIWLKRLCEQINSGSDVVQLFQRARWMFGNGHSMIHKGFAHHFFGGPEGKKFNHGEHKFPHPGFAWAARTDFWDHCGFFDRNVCGSGDTEMAHALAQFDPEQYWLWELKPKWIFDAIAEWRSKFPRVPKMTALPIMITHMFHGTGKNRRYNEKQRFLKEFNIQPEDLFIGPGGLWHCRNKEFVKAFGEHSRSREEDEDGV